jgi:hypothetical protein
MAIQKQVTLDNGVQVENFRLQFIPVVYNTDNAQNVNLVVGAYVNAQTATPVTTIGFDVEITKQDVVQAQPNLFAVFYDKLMALDYFSDAIKI